MTMIHWDERMRRDVMYAAQACVRAGWAPLPVRFRGKEPVSKDWPAVRLTEAQCEEQFGTVLRNLGVLLGEASNGLVDVDLDTPEAARLAPLFLPKTLAVFGRTSKPQSHWLYQVTGEVKTERFVAPAEAGQRGAMLLEIRASGCQTVIPPSIHPASQGVVWDTGVGWCPPRPGEEYLAGLPTPTTLDAETLRAAVGRLAAATLLARHWPAQGARQEVALALAGGLLRAGWGPDQAGAFIRAVAGQAGDEEAEKRAATAQDTQARLTKGGTAYGWTQLGKTVGEAVASRVVAWLGFAIDAHPAPSSPPMSASGENEPLWTAVLADQVEPRPLRWVWPGWLPLGCLVMLDGDPGLGKSALTLDLAARLSTGRTMPDGQRGDLADPAVVAVLSAEDAAATIIRPRLAAAGADLSKIVLLEGYGFLPDHFPALAEALRRHQVKLLIIDPLVAYINPTYSTIRDQDVRVALRGLVEFAEQQQMSVVAVRHLNKSAGVKALYRGGGSIGLVAGARTGWVVGADPHDPTETRRVLAMTKTNVSRKQTSLAFHLQPHPNQSVSVAWEGPSQLTADALLTDPPPDDPSAMEEAQAFLKQSLAEGPRPSAEVQQAAQTAGITPTTLRRARRQLGVVARVEGFQGRWVLALPDEAAATA